MEEQVDINEMIESLASSILSHRDEAIKHRAASGVERRWAEDEAGFDGLDTAQRASMLDYATKTAPPREAKTSRSKVLVNIIRGKCEQTVSRFSDIQLPVDDKNWGLKATPVPELSTQASDETPVVRDGEPVMYEGHQVTLAELARSEMDEAQEAMEGMEKEIDDQLNECSFNAECRKVAHDAVVLGTGILKGPNVIKNLRKMWTQSDEGFVLGITEEHVPISKRVDPWNVFPDPECGEDIKRAGYVWERDYILPRELRKLKGVKGYISSQIDKVLGEEPQRTTTTMSKHTIEIEMLKGKHQTYEMWEYHGDLGVEELSILGCDCGDLKGAVSACVLFVNDHPVKAVLNLLDTGDLPYDFFQWTQVTNSVWGIGIPRILMWQQRIITAAWRMMMDNGRNSTKVHAVKSSDVRLVDDTGPVTFWEATADMVDVRQAFGVFHFPSNQQDLQQIIDLALQFVDLETSLPTAFPHEPIGPAETLGAVELKVDSSNVTLRGRVKLWDDNITRPHLTRYYHWNMQYNDNDEVKGDYNVDPRGVSVLLLKDKAVESIMQLFQLRADPVIGAVIDWVKAIKQVLSAQNIDILKSDEEIDAALKALEESPPQDPKAAKALEAATVKVQGELEKEGMRSQTAQMKTEAEMQSTAQKLALDAEENERKRQHDLQLALINRETKMLELAARSDMTLEQIKAELGKTAMKLDVQRELSELNALRDRATKQVAVDPVEPQGKAKPGRAFEE